MNRWLSFSPRRQALALLAGVFVSGVLAGSAVERLWARRTQAGTDIEIAVPLMLDRLGLSREQRAAVDSIALSYRPRTEAVLGEALPRLRALTDSMDRDIRARLTATQQARLDELLAKFGNQPMTPALIEAPGRGVNAPVLLDSVPGRARRPIGK